MSNLTLIVQINFSVMSTNWFNHKEVFALNGDPMMHKCIHVNFSSEKKNFAW